METAAITTTIDHILDGYKASFSGKLYAEENNQLDLLMTVFGITPDLKRENRQYWGRELGMCWQRIVVAIFKHYHQGYAPPLRVESGEPCDLLADKLAIDTKYRIGSGDAGTLKKFRQYAALLKGQGYTPVLLVLREDNLPAAMTACREGGWQIYVAAETYAFIREYTGFSLEDFLQQRALAYTIER